MKAILDRRRSILLAAIVQYRPTTLAELRRTPPIQLWQDAAFINAVDAAIADGVLIDAGGPDDPLIAITDARWSL